MNGMELCWASDDVGAGLRATRDLPAGTATCSVPRSLLLSRASALDDPLLGPLLTDLEDELEDEANSYDASQSLIALQLLSAFESVRRGEATRCRWSAYVASLPTEINTPVLWPRRFRNALLVGTSLLSNTRELRGSANP